MQACGARTCAAARGRRRPISSPDSGVSRRWPVAPFRRRVRDRDAGDREVGGTWHGQGDVGVPVPGGADVVVAESGVVSAVRKHSSIAGRARATRTDCRSGVAAGAALRYEAGSRSVVPSTGSVWRRTGSQCPQAVGRPSVVSATAVPVGDPQPERTRPDRTSLPAVVPRCGATRSGDPPTSPS